MTKSLLYRWFLGILLLLNLSCEKKNQDDPPKDVLQLMSVTANQVVLSLSGTTTGIPVEGIFTIEFNNSLDTSTIRNNIHILKNSTGNITLLFSYQNENRTVLVQPKNNLDYKANYTLDIASGLKGANKETFPGVKYYFSTLPGKMTITSITLNGSNFSPPALLKNIDREKVNIVVNFSDSLNSSNYQSFFTLTGNPPASISLSADQKKVSYSTTSALEGLKQYYFDVSPNLASLNGKTFDGFTNRFYTELDSTPKFPLISDEELLTLVQQQTFKYFWDFGHPVSGLARERNSSGDVVTTGGSGFGIMAIIVGVERGFISRSDALIRMNKILGFLETCDRFHGVWPHWLNGNTGKVVPFSTNDNGADLVESAFLMQGLLAFRQYLNPSVTEEQTLISRINTLWNGMEWDWFTRGQNVLYWHWSPDKGWIMNMQIRGNNETMICYILGVASPTHPINIECFHQGYMQNGSIVNGNNYYGIKLPLGEPMGGPLFFTHYSFLGLDSRNLSDKYASYWEQNQNHTLINRAYCIANPRNYAGYSKDCWGLTASDNQNGYSAHSPTNDLGVITPTAALSSLPYSPSESMEALRFFYYILGNKLWGPYGFYDAFNLSTGWWANSYLAIDQGPIIVMIENHRTRLIWNLFMSCPEIKSSLTKIGFTY